MEKTPLKSKKFIAYLLAEISWKIIIIIGLLELIASEDGGPMLLHWVMLTSVIIAGFIEAGFIGGQAWLDRYVRIAQITTNGAKGGDTPPDDPTLP